jgi:hypothetical protein
MRGGERNDALLSNLWISISTYDRHESQNNSLIQRIFHNYNPCKGNKEISLATPCEKISVGNHVTTHS